MRPRDLMEVFTPSRAATCMLRLICIIGNSRVDSMAYQPNGFEPDAPLSRLLTRSNNASARNDGRRFVTAPHSSVLSRLRRGLYQPASNDQLEVHIGDLIGRKAKLRCDLGQIGPKAFVGSLKPVGAWQGSSGDVG